MLYRNSSFQSVVFVSAVPVFRSFPRASVSFRAEMCSCFVYNSLGIVDVLNRMSCELFHLARALTLFFFPFIPFKHETQIITQGQRLGSASDAATPKPGSTSNTKRPAYEDNPKPVVNKNLTDEERAKIREDRAAAAEKRAKQNQIGGKKKKKSYASSELKGPNSRNAMTWNVWLWIDLLFIQWFIWAVWSTVECLENHYGLFCQAPFFTVRRWLW